MDPRDKAYVRTTLGGVGARCWRRRPGRSRTAGPAPRTGGRPARPGHRRCLPRVSKPSLVCRPTGPRWVAAGTVPRGLPARGPLVPSPSMSLLRCSGPTPRRLSTVVTLTVALGTLVASCSTPSPTASTTSSIPPQLTEAGLPAVAPPPPITWTACAAHAGVQCGTVPVPLDYAHPGPGTLQIAVSRIPARPEGRHRTGPCSSTPEDRVRAATRSCRSSTRCCPPTVRATMDVVSFDPRGTGASDPLQCGTSLAGVTSALPGPRTRRTATPGNRRCSPGSPRPACRPSRP